MADLKLGRLLDTIDALDHAAWARRSMYRRRSDSRRRESTDRPAPDARLSRRTNIGTVMWATGFRPDYWWLHVPVLDRKGRLRHDGRRRRRAGSVRTSGLNFMRRRKSTFMHGAEDDVRDRMRASRYLPARRRAHRVRHYRTGRTGLSHDSVVLRLRDRYATTRRSAGATESAARNRASRCTGCSRSRHPDRAAC